MQVARQGHSHVGIYPLVSMCEGLFEDALHYSDLNTRGSVVREFELPELDAKPMKTHYQALRIPQEATAEHIKRSYRSLVKRCHPDLFPSGSEAHAEAGRQMREINVAYATLSNPRKRATYDRTLKRHSSPYQGPKPEHCNKCGKPTLYWHVEDRNVATCDSCGGLMRNYP